MKKYQLKDRNITLSMSGSFWKFSNGFTSLSNISTLLENHSINQESGDQDSTSNYDVLMKLLDENDLLQELLSNNSLLLEYLRDDEVLSILVELVINEGTIKSDLNSKLSNLKIQDDGSDDEKAEIDESGESQKTESNESSFTQKLNNDEIKNAEDETNHIFKHDSDEDPEDDSNVTEDHEDEEDEDFETAEEKRNRHATLAAEILSADVWSLTDTVMESTENLNKLWSILDVEAPLSINLSSFFMKIMEHLLDMKCEEMITYLIDNQPFLVKKFMNHLSNPPLMDFLLKLISTDKQDNATGIIDFLQNQELITYLINSLDITNTSDKEYDILLVKQSSAADFLKALITISANSTTDNSTIGPNELTRELVSYDQLNRLCSIMLKGGYALANGVGIIIEIIRKNNSDYDILPVLYITLESHPPTGRDPIYLGHLLKVFGDKIDDFNKLLMNFDGKEAPKLKTPFGEIEPLGFERFKICELIAELLHCSNMALLNDNKGYDVVKERDALRLKMKDYDPISFKYNEVIILPNSNDQDDSTNIDDNSSLNGKNNESDNESRDITDNNNNTNSNNDDDDDEFGGNDTIDSFNSRLHQDEENSMIQHNNISGEEDEDEPHANANLSEEQIRAKPVIGDFLKIALFDTQIITNILSMFFKFPWNNFLHNVVFDIVQQVLNGSMDIGFNKFLAIDLFNRGDITNKIIEGQKLCSEYETNHNGLRLGFMGHLTLIAEEVVKFIQLYPINTLSNLIDEKIEDDVWSDYVSHVLYDTREKYNAILGGGEEDDDDEEEDDTSRSFDEGTGEVIEKNFDPNVDHDILGSGYQENNRDNEDDYHERIDEEDEEEDDEVDENNSKIYQFDSQDDDDLSHDEQYKNNTIHDNGDESNNNKSNNSTNTNEIRSSSSDESESDDDDHFTNYMSQQLTNTASTEIISSKKDLQDTEDHDSDDDYYQFKDSVDVSHDDGNDDDYIDPNDDGLSYKKSHPLYDAHGTLKTGDLSNHNEFDDEDELSIDDSSSSSSSDNEDEILYDDEETDPQGGVTGTKLTRAASKG